jgi:endonuclease YncB( thermonuclease family)
MARVWFRPLLVALALAGGWSRCAGDTLRGHVVRIVDGDTISLLVALPDGGKAEEKIRLAGIDCPEKGQPWGTRAKQQLSDHIYDRDVTIEANKADRYHRIVGKVLDGERDVNLAMVADGLCWWYRKYASEQTQVDQGLYQAAESAAKIARQGLWGDPEPVPPWEWRHRP